MAFLKHKSEFLTVVRDFLNLYRFSTVSERRVIIGMLFLISLVSMSIPLSQVLYSTTTGMIVDRSPLNGTSDKVFLVALFGGRGYPENATTVEIAEILKENVWTNVYLSIGMFLVMVPIMAFVIYMMNLIALKQTMRMRKIFLKSVLSQDMAWFDCKSGLDCATKITSSIDLIRDAIGEKIVTVLFLVFAFGFGVLFSVLMGWKLTIIMCITFTLINVAFSIFVGKSENRFTEQEIESYTNAGSIAEEVFNSIRTVTAFGGAEMETKRYAENLKIAEKSGIKKSFYSGLQNGIMWFLSFLGWAFGMFLGIHFMAQELDLPSDMRTYNAISILTIVSSLIHNSQLLTLTIPSLDIISTARNVFKAIYQVIDKKSGLDPFSMDGMTLGKNFKGNIRFDNVEFRYPSRPTVEVLKDVSFTLQTQQTIALVGHSGCGKSTCIQLLQRLYDPSKGNITIDGVDIKQLNIAYLRSQIGVVQQEPVLFSGTIAENIRFGNPTASMEEITNAANIAYCHKFIETLPDGYNTMLGENGAQLSGGQKQRIAIARAIVRNPKILLLDEATSALDSDSERIVQKALDNASEGRTTLIISHRLSSIRKANQIIVFDQGQIVERGTYEELINKKGALFKLYMANKEVSDKHTLNKGMSEYLLTTDSLTVGHINQDRKKSEGIVPCDPEFTKSTMNRTLKLAFSEWKLMSIGILSSLIMGVCFPISSFFYARLLKAFQFNDLDEIYSVTLSNVTFLIITAILIGSATFVQNFSLGKAGVRITSMLRRLSFSAALKQEIAWFDIPENSVGALCTRLSTDCANVQGATGSRLAGNLQAMASVSVGVLIGLCLCWKLALVVSATLPLLLFVAVFDSHYAKASMEKVKISMENASRIAVEAINNVRTVASLGQEQHVLDKFNKELAIAEIEVEKSIRFRGLAYSLNISMNFCTYAIAFLYAVSLISDGEVDFVDAVVIIEVISFGAWMTGIILMNAPNVNLAISSAANIFNLIDRLPNISDSNYQPDISGNVNIDKVVFHYPNRPTAKVLKGFSLQIPQGKTIALVGPSGCGKSTCIQLLLRFYDPKQGRINFDGTPNCDISLKHLRSQLALVSQEPVLFDRTIAENIAYGDNSRKVSMEEIIEAAKEAQIHSEFIIKLPLGYDTPLGPRGTQLSGGQKQRIAIARALVRKPKILLLDEPTSALDVECEKSVQTALDRASKNRTCIVIAHRLSTIQNADLICVIERGHIVKMGTYDEIINSGELHYQL